MRILGVDFGDARTGLSLSDPSGLLASGAGCVHSTNLLKTAEEVARIAAERKADKIVVGHPINMNGTEGPRSERVKAFCARLAEYTALPIELYDERLSTANAHQILNMTGTHGAKRREVIDEMSACLILQNYLDRMRNTANQN